MDVQFCLDAVQEAIDRYGLPEIFNTDQGSQFTSLGWAGIWTSTIPGVRTHDLTAGHRTAFTSMNGCNG